MVRDVTADEVKAGMPEGTTVVLRSCSMCGTPLSYFVENGSPWYDSNCCCVTYTTKPKACDWKELADLINMQTNDDVKVSMAAQFGVTLTKEVEDEVDV